MLWKNVLRLNVLVLNNYTSSDGYTSHSEGVKLVKLPFSTDSTRKFSTTKEPPNLESYFENAKKDKRKDERRECI